MTLCTSFAVKSLQITKHKVLTTQQVNEMRIGTCTMIFMIIEVGQNLFSRSVPSIMVSLSLDFIFLIEPILTLDA